MAALTAKNVSVRHTRQGVFAVTDISLEVNAGVCMAICGPNGTGKSTLIRALAGLSSGFVSGTVSIFGADISSLTADRLSRRRSFVAQDNPMPFAFSVREAVSLGVTATDNATHINAELEKLELLPLADRSVLALSGGERQRVAIARAFLQATPLLLFDEPTAHQDLRHSQAVLSRIRANVLEYPKERAAIVVLHDLNLAREWTDEVVLMKDGTIFARGEAAQTLNSETLSALYETRVEITPFIHAKHSI